MKKKNIEKNFDEKMKNLIKSIKLGCITGIKK